MKNTGFFSKAISQVLTGIILVFLAFFLSLVLGAQKIPVSALFTQGTPFYKTILLNIRLPRSLLVLITGLLLGGSGAVFQLFFRNPLAEPAILGISSGATLAAVIASLVFPLPAVTFLSDYLLISPVNLSAFAGALLAGLLVTFLAFSKAGRNSSVMLLLCGTALGTLYSAISSTILYTSSKDLRGIFSWIMGSFNGRGWNELLVIIIPSILCMILLFFICPQLDLMNGGEKSAESLGLNVNRLRILTLICGSLAISTCVCAGGTIGFVGLIAPHLVRKFCGPKANRLIPLSMISGAFVLLISDTLARTVIRPAELPAGIITSMIGVPFFIILCLKKK